MSGEAWRRRLMAQGFTLAQWRRMRAVVAATLPAPCTVCADLVHPWQRWHLEHRIPLARGGPALDPDNLGPAHAACNLRKGAGSVVQRSTTVPPSRPW